MFGSDFNSERSWDFFISGYNLSERIRYVYDKASAGEKIWLIAPEYNINPNQFPPEPFMNSDTRDEGEIVRQLLSNIEISKDVRICIDSTGFVRPHLLTLVRILFDRGVRNLDVLYSEPESYKDKERTQFSFGALNDVRQIMGFEGENRLTGEDLLIIGSGYDNKMISKVAESQSTCRIIQMFGFPPLRPDMYQENLFRVSEAENYTDQTVPIFAPASDPFVTASVLRETVERFENVSDLGNLYLSPLGTKAQVLGFGLYYLSERLNSSTSIIFPMTDVYSNDTTRGVSRVWKYEVEL